MAVTGIILLGKRIALDDWKIEYKEDEDVYSRICDFSQRNTYAMPILEYIPTNTLSLKEIQNEIPEFMAPQMYYNLADGSPLLELIDRKIKITGEKIINAFDTEIKDEICKKIT